MCATIAKLAPCMRCKKREAIYVRATSGERLCKLCLRDSVVKQVRKALNYYKMVTRGSGVLFVIRIDKPLLSLTALSLYKSAAKDFSVKLHALCFQVKGATEYCRQLMGAVKDEEVDVTILEVEPTPPLYNFVAATKFMEAAAFEVARRSGFRFISTPLFRDELLLFTLLGILKISKTVFGEGMPVKYMGEIKVVRPFYYVVMSDAIFLTMLRHNIEDLELALYGTHCVASASDSEFNALARRVMYESPELMYSSGKAVELLQSYIIGGSQRCSVCGSFSDSDPCDYCRSLRGLLEQLRASDFH